MRRSPYGTALTLEDYEQIEPTLTRPLTDDPIRPRRAHIDARLSRLVATEPRRTPRTEETTAA